MPAPPATCPTLQPGQCRVAAPAPRRGQSFECHLVRQTLRCSQMCTAIPPLQDLEAATTGEKHSEQHNDRRLPAVPCRYLPNAGKDAVGEHLAERIPGALFFGEAL